jgi:prepilin-type N-terminal cleavage/methylation domain-containing protein
VREGKKSLKKRGERGVLMKNLKNKKGFTLIEMLVVIAIIAVLVAIIIPVVQSSTTKAAAATNAANLRSYKAELVTIYLSSPNDIVFEADGKTVQSVTADGKAVTAPTAKKVGSFFTATDTPAIAVLNGNDFDVYFKESKYDISYFATIAETGKEPTSTTSTTETTK